MHILRLPKSKMHQDHPLPRLHHSRRRGGLQARSGRVVKDLLRLRSSGRHGCILHFSFRGSDKSMGSFG